MTRLVTTEGRRVLALEYARTDTHRQRVAGSVAMIQRARSHCRWPYVAFSGGKDSMVLLSLVEQLSGGVVAAWSDDELEFPETVAMMEKMHGQMLFVVTLGYGRHGGWFTPWMDQPFWRDPFPDATRIDTDQDDWMASLGHDLTFLGTRAEESRKRRDWLTYAAWRWEGIYPVQSGTGTRCCPIWDWTVDDIWAYTLTHRLPVNPVYAKLDAIGVPVQRQRLGPLPLARRDDLEAGWPELLKRLERRYGTRWS